MRKGSRNRFGGLGAFSPGCVSGVYSPVLGKKNAPFIGQGHFRDLAETDVCWAIGTEAALLYRRKGWFSDLILHSATKIQMMDGFVTAP